MNKKLKKYQIEKNNMKIKQHKIVNNFFFKNQLLRDFNILNCFILNNKYNLVNKAVYNMEC